MNNTIRLCIAAFCAGSVTGILGAGGGMILLPLLSILCVQNINEFSSSLLIMLPICAVSFLIRLNQTTISWIDALPYLLGSTIGGIGAGIWGKKIPALWLHRLFGVIILIGGMRFLWN